MILKITCISSFGTGSDFSLAFDIVGAEDSKLSLKSLIEASRTAQSGLITYKGTDNKVFCNKLEFLKILELAKSCASNVGISFGGFIDSDTLGFFYVGHKCCFYNTKTDSLSCNFEEPLLSEVKSKLLIIIDLIKSKVTSIGITI